LSIARELAGRMGGDVTAAFVGSAPGAAFELTLPKHLPA
jgi:hypothetical protein